MVRQNARNNPFLREVKLVYNEPTYKRVLKYVNDGEQKLAEFLLQTGLFYFELGDKAGRILMQVGYQPNPQQSAGDLIGVARHINGGNL